MTPQSMAARNVYKVVCMKPDGTKRWEEERKNLVTDEGLNDVLQQYFKGSNYNATHYVGLKNRGTISASDTMGRHPGWAEAKVYAGSRKRLALGNAANESITNDANRAQFDINAKATLAGIFVCTTATGTGGVLYGVVDFGTDRPVESNDILLITTTFTMRSA